MSRLEALEPDPLLLHYGLWFFRVASFEPLAAELALRARCLRRDSFYTISQNLVGQTRIVVGSKPNLVLAAWSGDAALK